MTTNKASDESKDKAYFTITPQLVWAMSEDPYDFTLWNVIKMITGDSGECYLGTEDLATLSMMSAGKVSQCRKRLIKHGLLEGELRRDPGYPQPVWHLSIPDLWERNLKWRHDIGDDLRKRIEFKNAQRESLHNMKASPGEEGITPDERGIPPGEEGITPDETKDIQKEIQLDNQEGNPTILSADAEKAESPDDIVESIAEQTRTHLDQFDLGRATEEVQAKAGNYADPLEDALIDTAIILFCNGRAPKKDSGTYRDMANVIGEVHTAYDLSSEEKEGAMDAVRLAVRQFIAEKPKMAVYKYPSFAANYAQYLIRALNGEAEETHPQDDFDATWEEATRMTWERLHGDQQ